MGKIILFTGGQRSGKSAAAERLALSLAEKPVYIATAHIGDEDFRRRVEAHRRRRGPQWTNIEEERYLSQHDLSGKVVLIDCITLWLSNLFLDKQDVEQTFATAKADFDRLVGQADATFIFVTNEIGSGGTSIDRVQRLFTDLQGQMNQYVASWANEVYLMVSGIAVKIKG